MSVPLCVVGDSITGGVVYLEDSQRYVHLADSFMNLLSTELGLELHNHSRFGCTTPAALRKMKRYESDIAGCPYTLVMLGGNDSDFDWPAVAETPEVMHDCRTPMAQFRESYDRVLDYIEELGSRPIVMNLIPVWGERYYKWFSRKADPEALMRFLRGTVSIERWNEMYNLAVMKAAAARRLPILDVRSAFLGIRGYEGMYCEDGIHPSPAGHRRMAQYLLPQLKSAICD